MAETVRRGFYRAETLPNGRVHVWHVRSGLTGTFYPNGEPATGDLARLAFRAPQLRAAVKAATS